MTKRTIIKKSKPRNIKMKMGTVKELDLRDPKDCRWYLSNFTLHTESGESSTVKEYVNELGEHLTVENMTDEQLVSIANQMYNDLDLPSQKARLMN